MHLGKSIYLEIKLLFLKENNFFFRIFSAHVKDMCNKIEMLDNRNFFYLQDGFMEK